MGARSRHVAPALLLVASDQEVSIRDLGSRNGTLVNGVPVEQQQMRHGDQIYIGDSVLLLLLQEDGEPSVRNPVEFQDTAAFEGSPLLLRAEDSRYLQPDLHLETIGASSPLSARRARDLNSLLKIATGIGGIRDQDSLQWQLLGFIFDVVPAERGAVLLCDTRRSSLPPLPGTGCAGPAIPFGSAAP